MAARKAAGSTACPAIAGATEVAAVYFEDPCLRPGIMNLAVRKGLWPYLLKYVAALRSHSAAASLHSPSQQVRPSLAPNLSMSVDMGLRIRFLPGCPPSMHSDASEVDAGMRHLFANLLAEPLLASN